MSFFSVGCQYILLSTLVNYNFSKYVVIPPLVLLFLSSHLAQDSKATNLSKAISSLVTIAFAGLSKLKNLCF